MDFTTLFYLRSNDKFCNSDIITEWECYIRQPAGLCIVSTNCEAATESGQFNGSSSA